MPTKADSGSGISEGLRHLGATAALIVATIYPTAVSASVVLTLTGRAVARVAVPVGVPVGPRARDLWPALMDAADRVYPDAVKVTLLVVLDDGREAWLPVSSSRAGVSPSSTPGVSASTVPRT